MYKFLPSTKVSAVIIKFSDTDSVTSTIGACFTIGAMNFLVAQPYKNAKATNPTHNLNFMCGFLDFQI